MSVGAAAVLVFHARAVVTCPATLLLDELALTCLRSYLFLAAKLRKAGIFSRVDDSNATIGKRYARNDELGTPYGLTLDFACTSSPPSTACRGELTNVSSQPHPPTTAVQNRTMTLR